MPRALLPAALLVLLSSAWCPVAQIAFDGGLLTYLQDFGGAPDVYSFPAGALSSPRSSFGGDEAASASRAAARCHTARTPTRFHLARLLASTAVPVSEAALNIFCLQADAAADLRTIPPLHVHNWWLNRKPGRVRLFLNVGLVSRCTCCRCHSSSHSSSHPSSHPSSCYGPGTQPELVLWFHPNQRHTICGPGVPRIPGCGQYALPLVPTWR